MLEQQAMPRDIPIYFNSDVFVEVEQSDISEDEEDTHKKLTYRKICSVIHQHSQILDIIPRMATGYWTVERHQQFLDETDLTIVQLEEDLERASRPRRLRRDAEERRLYREETVKWLLEKNEITRNECRRIRQNIEELRRKCGSCDNDDNEDEDDDDDEEEEDNKTNGNVDEDQKDVNSGDDANFDVPQVNARTEPAHLEQVHAFEPQFGPVAALWLREEELWWERGDLLGDKEVLMCQYEGIIEALEKIKRWQKEDRESST